MQFIYVLDPMCSWCWAFQRSFSDLTAQYPEIPTQYLLGGLAPDTDEPMPGELRTKLQDIWRHIEAKTGTPFNHAFWQNNTPRRSTWRACRAVILAEDVGTSSVEMVAAIQQAYYTQALNPSDRSTLVDICRKLGGDAELFSQKLDDPETQEALNQHRQLASQLGAEGFPALLLAIEDKVYPIAYGYTDGAALITRTRQIISEASLKK